jgi:uncharacterized membrane protein
VGLLVSVPVTALALVHAYRALSGKAPEAAMNPTPTPATPMTEATPSSGM